MFWAEAVNTSNYLRNRCVTSGLGSKTPFEMWHGRQPDVSGLRIFGSKVIVHVPKQKRLKFDKKSSKNIFMGYSENIKRYRIYNLTSNVLTVARDVVFYEDFNSKKYYSH